MHETDRLPALRAELTGKILRQLGTSEKLVTAIPGLTLHQRRGPTEPCSVAYVPGLVVMAQGRKKVFLGDQSFSYSPDRYLLTSLDLPSVSQVVEASEERPALAFALKLDLPMVRGILLKEELASEDISTSSPAMTTGLVTPELLGACTRLLELLEQPRDQAFLGDLIQREIVYRILRSPEGARLRAIATQGEQSQRCAMAAAWLKANYDKPLRVEELARMARMGVSTFHHHFRQLTAMSPLQYQKQLRLQAARAQMLTEGLDASSAAVKVGYESVSQFSREYSRLFGQPPMRDVRSVRDGAAGIGGVLSQ